MKIKIMARTKDSTILNKYMNKQNYKSRQKIHHLNVQKHSLTQDHDKQSILHRQRLYVVQYDAAKNMLVLNAITNKETTGWS